LILRNRSSPKSNIYPTLSTSRVTFDIKVPGLVDAHVHLEEPGKQDWEGFWTGTQAAAAGGVTTLIDMPVDSSPPTTTPRNLDIKRHSARGQCWVDVGFWGGAIPQNQAESGPLLSAGVRGFKCFLIDTGIELHIGIPLRF